MSIQNLRRSVLIAAAAGALALSGLFAGRLLGRQMGPEFPHGPRASHMFNHIARELDLTDAQRTQVRAILKTHADEILTQVRAGMDARRTLHEAVMVEPPDEAAIRALGAQVGTVHADGALLFTKVRSEIWPILTAEQQQKFASFHSRMGRRGDEGLQSLASFLRGDS